MSLNEESNDSHVYSEASDTSSEELVLKEEKVDEKEIGLAIVQQQKMYNQLLADRIKFQKNLQHFNADEKMFKEKCVLCPKEELDENLRDLNTYYTALKETSFGSIDDLDDLYFSLLNEAQQETKLNGMQTISEQITTILEKDSDRLIKKTHVNRLEKTTNPLNFDDSDFYSGLLKEYLEQQSDTPDAQAKIKKFKQSIKMHTRQVDRKGNKAKLLNIEKVHEKIKGFVPQIHQYPGLWEQESIGMLKQSLFGQSVTVEPVQHDSDFRVF